MLSKLAPSNHLDLKPVPVLPGPPSPTHSTSSFMSSISWMAEKTTLELLPLLKNAYSALKDKEKDLMLAAEIGKSLLEHNMKLKTSYDSLLKLNTPTITPSSSTNTTHYLVTEVKEEEEEEEEMQIIPSRRTREAMLEVLERKNTELTDKLEQTILEKENMSRSNLKKTRQLENEIELLKSNLEIASSKILELQELNARQKKMVQETSVDDEKDELVDELYAEIHKVKKERDVVVQSKQDIESKLVNTLKDLSNLKDQFEKFEFTQQDFDRLQEAYESQFDHIQELTGSLEEHRTLLQSFKEKSMADIFNEQPEQEQQPQDTLLKELEIGWMKSTLPQSPSEDMFHLRNFDDFKQQPIYRAPSIGFESVLSKATGIDQQLLDETLDFIDKIEQEHNKEKCMTLLHNFTEGFSVMSDEYPPLDLYPSVSSLKTALVQLELHPQDKSIIGRVKWHIKGLFDSIWKWCRFAIILTTALLINAWKGPDALLLTY